MLIETLTRTFPIKPVVDQPREGALAAMLFPPTLLQPASYLKDEGCRRFLNEIYEGLKEAATHG